MTKPWTGYGPVSPFWPDFRDSVDIELDFKTAVIESRSGRESFVPQRPFARAAVEFTTAQHGDRLYEWIEAAQSPEAPLVVPYGFQKTRLAAAASATATQLTVSEVPGWLVAGVRLIVHETGVDEAVKVASVSASTVTLTSALVVDHAEGAEVFRAALGYMQDGPNMRQVLHDRWRGRVRFETDPGDFQIKPGSAAPAPPETGALGNIEVLLHTPQWAAPQGFERIDVLDVFDPGQGRKSLVNAKDHVPHVSNQRLLAKSRAEIDALTDFFLRHRGRALPFYADVGLPGQHYTGTVPAPGDDLHSLTPDDPARAQAYDPYDPDNIAYAVPLDTGNRLPVFRVNPAAGAAQWDDMVFGAFSPEVRTYGIPTLQGPTISVIDAGLASAFIDFGAICTLDGETSLCDLYGWIIFHRGVWNADGSRSQGTQIQFNDFRSTVETGLPPDTEMRITETLPIPAETRFIEFRGQIVVWDPFSDVEVTSRDFGFSWPQDTPGQFESMQPIPQDSVSATIRPLRLARFNQDGLSVRHMTDSKARLDVSVRTVNPKIANDLNPIGSF